MATRRKNAAAVLGFVDPGVFYQRPRTDVHDRHHHDEHPEDGPYVMTIHRCRTRFSSQVSMIEPSVRSHRISRETSWINYTDALPGEWALQESLNLHAPDYICTHKACDYNPKEGDADVKYIGVAHDFVDATRQLENAGARYSTYGDLLKI